MKVEYHVNTQHTDEYIMQQVTAADIFDRSKYEVLSSTIIRLTDDGVRNALIKLGWTPPKGKHD